MSVEVWKIRRHTHTGTRGLFYAPLVPLFARYSDMRCLRILQTRKAKVMHTVLMLGPCNRQANPPTHPPCAAHAHARHLSAPAPTLRFNGVAMACNGMRHHCERPTDRVS